MISNDLTIAIYWRIGAIVATLCSIFSVSIVLWFLIFRDNPNRPDDTDTTEKVRFVEEVFERKHNLISEIFTALKNIPSFHILRPNEPEPQKFASFCQRLYYFIIGHDEPIMRNIDCNS
jgi:hypothetical protein